ncbi:MAG: Fe-S cluster assembly protein SufD [Thiobacillaceae bacterium]
MKATTEFTQRYNKALSDILERTEPSWLQERRSGAYALFQRLGLPTTRDEDWKYTSLAGIDRAPLETWVDEAPVPAGLPAASFDWAYAHRLVFVDGRFNPGLSILREPEPGVTLMPLSQAVTLNRAAAQKYLGQIDSGTAALDAFNTALWRDGLYLELERGVRLSRPLLVHCLSTGGRLVPVHHLIVLGEGAQALLIEHYQSVQAGVHFTNAVTECLLGTGAELTHIKLQDEHDQAFHTARIVARQEAGSRWLSLSLAAGGALTRNEIISHLDGEGASCTLNGLAVGAGRRHVDHHTYIDHSQPSCVSRQHYRGLLTGRSRVVFNGRVKVEKGAIKTDAQQINRNLLLSKDAEADSKPQLEIYADEVKCSHGAASGGLDEAQLFYLRSRGLDAAQARAMLLQAFATAVLDVIEDTDLKLALTDWLAAKLPSGDA